MLSHLSPEQIKLQKYFQILDVWNRRYHLIGKNLTSDKIIGQCSLLLETAQKELGLQVDETVVLDIGSGAGLPGLIWSILSDVAVYMVDLRANRCAFLSHCVQELNLNGHVTHADIRKFVWAGTLSAVDQKKQSLVITAQAFASIVTILDYSKHLFWGGTSLIFLKNANADEELSRAGEKYTFEYKTLPCEYGVIVILWQVKPLG